MGGRVRCVREGAVGGIVFDQPGRRNAISVEMWEQLPSTVEANTADPEARFIVQRGEGDARGACAMR
jgi:enoyl-CoA hydratase/carnithine racemase